MPVSDNSSTDNGGGLYNRNGHISLTDSTVSGNESDRYGGGVHTRGQITVTNSTVSGNSSRQNGGGLYSRSGNISLTDSTVSGNSSNRHGGGIWARSRTITLTNSTVSGNSSRLSAGGMYSQTANIIDSVVSGNSSGDLGGGVYATGTTNITNSTISGNSSANKGGGIYFRNNLTLSNSTISGNSSNRGGGIYSRGGGTVNLSNSTISGNSSIDRGGGIFARGNGGGTIEILNSTIADNEAGGDGGGIFRNGGTINLTNAIVADNTANGNGNDLSGLFNTVQYSLIRDLAGATITNSVSNLTGDNTNFGTADLASSIVVKTFTIENTGDLDLTLSGTHAADFRVTVVPISSIPSGNTTSFSITFNPSAVGLRTATLTITNDNGNPYTFDIQGTGIDVTAPIFTSIVRNTPATNPTDADTLVFRATFNENVRNVDSADFVVDGGTTATITDISPVSASVYDITVSGGDLANFNGTVGLNLARRQNIADLANLVGHALPRIEPSTDEIYTVENISISPPLTESENPAANLSTKPESTQDLTQELALELKPEPIAPEPLPDVRLILHQLEIRLPDFPTTGICGNDGDASDDLLLGDENANALCGLGGNDILAGFDETDRLDGNAGNDIIFGNTGNDTIDGGTGDDLIWAGKEDDLAIGGEGIDVIVGDIGNDTVDGNAGNDVVFGNRGADVLDGDDGDDVLFGGRDRDIVTGGTGNDVVRGDLGDDLLIGGAGGDRFDFRAGDGVDVVADFTDGVDIIGLFDGLTFADVTIAQVGNDTQISATGLVVTLHNVNVGAIDSNDFAVL